MPTKERPRKIGFMLASIHTGSSNNLWAVLANMAARSGDALYVFPGGRLDCREDFEYLRSSVYSLANAENLDGLISWSSSLGGFVSVDDVLRFHEQFEELPYVTIGLKKEGHPDISFDAYAGMKSEILHCISVHGARRIAFLRAPESHLSAEDRYHAYLDTLNECGIPIDGRLISDPMPWSSGGQALDQLVIDRKLVPGKDFDTLICASDLMMFRAGRRLEELDVTIPDDVRIAGFNDSHESQLLRVPCTTVSMPFSQMGVMAWDSLMQLLSSDRMRQGSPDVLLPAELIVRRSCGCEDSLGGPSQAASIITDRDSFLRWVQKAFHLSESEMFRRVVPLVDDALGACHGTDERRFLSLEQELSSLLLEYFSKNGDINLLYEALLWFRLFAPAGDAFRRFLSDRLQPMIGRTQNRMFNLEMFEAGRRARKLNSLKCDLLSLRSLASLPQILHAHLPGLGIDAAFLVLNGDEDFSQFVGGFVDEYVTSDRREFPHRELLPPDIGERMREGVYIVEPLFMENQPLGYLVLRTTGRDGGMFEELRSSLSSAIKGMFLLEVANQAREQAERAERSRTEFFANVSDGLRDPLHAILKLVDALKSDDSDVSSRLAMSQAIEKELSKANHLIDLTLSRTGELELEPRLRDAGRLLDRLCEVLGAESGDGGALPAVLVDETRIVQVVDIVGRSVARNGGRVLCSAQAVSDGLEIIVSSSQEGWDPRMTLQEPGFLLAERIMMMHDGRFSVDPHAVRCLLPWPTLSGERLKTLPDDQGAISVWAVSAGSDASAKIPDRWCGLSVRVLSGHGGIPVETPSLLMWDAHDACFETLSMLRMFRKDPMKNRIPFLCFNVPEGFSTLGDAVESIGQSFGGGAVFLFGELPPAMEWLVPAGEIVSLDSLDEYPSRCGDNPAGLLVVSKEVPVDAVEAIRRSRNGGSIPILLMYDTFDPSDVERLCLLPRVLICHACMAESDGVIARIRGLLAGDDILPPLTGALVKRAVMFLCRHATTQISRWQLADAVNVSEDYLTRIFRKELGISPWDYLNRYRIHLASQLLRRTAMTINEVASRTGFQDQAYFCRVFKKVRGCPPGKVRGR
ncbi:MAG: helix-turn-helix domain-containing protein [Sphaerochaetaceae bacterium]|jgi:DNA-binding LacI/PurR family transcriptional regulator/AraC-like DNA-binding protein